MRLQCHRERKTFVRKLGSNVTTSKPTTPKQQIELINKPLQPAAAFRSSLLEGHQLVVLNEANEPEEEEDTYDDIRARKQQQQVQLDKAANE